ncbi:heterokaryon incompatibility protein-domain-containing protein [Tricladium varicosporioides]|nr:heterokaryon incompatibility protein-domain-containing protein [Hymenoscyphus varicosporioides]
MWTSLLSLIASRGWARNLTTSPQNTALCNQCQPILFSWSNDTELNRRSPVGSKHFYKHSSSLSQLEVSSREGCGFCALLFHGLVTRHLKHDPELASIRDRYKDEPVILTPVLDNKTYTPNMEILAFCWDGKGERRLDTMFTFVDLPEKYARIIDLTVDNCNTGSPVSMNMARTWLDECVKGHTTCHITAERGKPFFPKRTIDVKPFDGSNDVCLFIPGDPETIVTSQPYVTLSHCWGIHQIITTTISNIEDHCQRIEWSKLSKTFQDAITTTRSLGFKYLWIDSLCIIQDSVKDWQTQSAVMGDIYCRSILTISAAKAKDSTEGCFAVRDGRSARPVQLYLRFGQRIDSKRTSRKSKESNPGAGRLIWASLLDNYASGPLYDRAWVYQEQALASRSLAFGEGGLYWQCPSMVASENEPMGSMYRYQGLQLPLLEFRSLLNASGKSSSMEHSSSGGLHTPPSGLKDRAELYNFWYTHVTAYSGRALTKITDRLVALSGLASEISKALGDNDNTYAAGLWTGDFLRGLLWMRGNKGLPGSGPVMRVRPPMKFVGPSWSWASMSGCHTTYDLIRRETQSGSSIYDDGLKIITVDSKSSGLDPFGGVLASTITLVGNLASVNISKQGNTYLLLKASTEVGELDLDDEEVFSENIWVLSIVYNNGTGYTISLALARTKHTSSSIQEYRRVGVAYVKMDHSLVYEQEIIRIV